MSQAPVVSEASAAVAPPVWGATVAALPSAVQDLARFFLSLAGSSPLGAVGGVAGAAAPASGVRAQLCPSILGGKSSCILCCDCNACWCGRLSCCSRCCARLVRPSGGLPAQVDVAVARAAMGPVVRRRSKLRIVPLPLVVLLDTGRSPIGLLRNLPKITEPRLLLPFLPPQYPTR